MVLIEILEKKYPTCEWVLRGDTYDGLEWLDSSPKPTESEVAALWDEFKAERAAADAAQANARKSALKKLEKLGLTADELQAIIGLN